MTQLRRSLGTCHREFSNSKSARLCYTLLEIAFPKRDPCWHPTSRLVRPWERPNRAAPPHHQAFGTFFIVEVGDIGFFYQGKQEYAVGLPAMPYLLACLPCLGQSRLAGTRLRLTLFFLPRK